MSLKRIIPLFAGLLLFVLLWTQGPVLAATITEVFDTDGNWSNISGSTLTAYGTKEYADTTYPEVTYHAEVTLRQTTATQDGVSATHSGAYSWRLRDDAGAFWQAKITTGGVGTFSVWVRRWDGSPDPDYTVEYSTNNGTSWTQVQTINNTWLGDTSDWKEVSGTIDTANGAGDADDIIIQVRRVGGERLMIDDFEMTDFSGVDVPPTVSSTSPSDGASNVALNAEITVTFSEDVTFNGNTVQYNCDRGVAPTFPVTPTGGPRTWTITPPSNFEESTTCVIIIDATDVTDLDGTFEPMANDYIFTFTTGSAVMSISELLLSEIVVTPTAGEFIEIHNPGATTVDLSNVYLTDATYAGGSTYYYNIVTGSNAGGGGYGDFHARFPDGASITAGEYQTITLTGSDDFFTEYSVNPTYELFEDGGASDSIPDMREALPGSINSQGGLTNDGEVVILYYWDGNTDLVTDLDYVVWGDKVEGVAKTSVSIDGPDADLSTTTYQNDTAIASQDVVATVGHAISNAWQRDDLNEGTETATGGGNGAEGHDETSENLSATWCESPTLTPNAANDCPDPIVINEIHADPDATNGDANGDGTVDTADDEFVEIVNTSGADLDISGWTLADGAFVRHTFPANTIIPADCAIVLFSGGTPTGSFGNAIVQTAGTLGLNNGGDTITITNGSKNYSVTYGSESGNNQSLTRDPDITGNFVQHSTATGSSSALFSPGTQIDGTSFSGCSGSSIPCDGNATRIHTIQGNGLASSLDGQTRTIEGIVIGDFQTTDELSGFYVQEEDADVDGDPATSEGIFVYNSTDAVTVGDHVSVTGVVDEFNELTEITNTTDVTVCTNGATLPTAVTLSMPFPADVGGVPYLETIENMRVVVPSGLVVTELYNLGRGGAFILSSGDRLYQPTEIALPDDTVTVNAITDLNRRNQIVVDDGSLSENPATVMHPAPELSLVPENRVRNGDTLAAEVTGVLTYRYYGWYNSDDAYRVHPTSGGATFNSVNPRTAAPPSVGTADIKVASFNVLNYFNGNGSGGGFPAPRGADTYSEFTRQHNKIVAAIIALDADIIGLMEIENDGYDSVSAIQDLVDGLNAAAAPGTTYAFVNPGVAQIGTDEIAVGLLYKQNSVSVSGTAQILDDSDDPTFNTDKNRPALAQTFTYDNDPTQALTVVVNHLKSKGTDCDALGDPDTGDGQGKCNLTRTAAATAEATWLGTDPTGSGDADFLVIGDLNAYSMEDPIMAFADGGFVNLTAGFESKYSYVYKGQFGHLDHALATPSLVSQISGTAVWHINSDEPPAFDYNDYNQAALYAPDAYRASDHDPVIIGIDFDQQSDFSDATSSYGFAWHTGTGAVRLGTEWTADTAFNVTPDVGDDGVTIGAGTGPGGQWQPGTDGASLNINVTGGTGCLYTWVDWNGDGVFDDSDDPGNLEYAIRSVVASPGTENYAFEVPVNQFQTPPGDITPLTTYNVRVRLYGACSSGPTGAAINGEVEDYTFAFTPTAVNLQSFSAANQTTIWVAVLLVVVTLLAGSLLIWHNGRSRKQP